MTGGAGTDPRAGDVIIDAGIEPGAEDVTGDVIMEPGTAMGLVMRARIQGWGA